MMPRITVAQLTERERAAGRIATNMRVSAADGGGVGVCVPGGDNDAVQLSGMIPGYTNLTNYAWYGDNSGRHDASGGAEAAEPVGLV